MEAKLLILKKKNLINVCAFFITLIVSFQVSAQDFSYETKKVASNRDASDYLGSSVAIDGDYAIASARGYDDHTTPVNNIGAIYFYEKDANGVWQETQVLTASDYHANDYAKSVSISGNYAVLGVPSHDYDENDANILAGAGAIFIFERDESGTWSEINKIVSSERNAGDSFGSSVSISGDYLAVGSSSHDPFNLSGSTTLSNAGAVFMVVKQQFNDEWLLVQKIVANDRAVDDYFGTSVAVNGAGVNPTVVVGAFKEDENIVGTSTKTDAGSAYIFNQTSGFTQTQKITASDRSNDDWFGRSVAIYQNTIVVGAIHEDQTASNTGSAYIFEKNGTWSQTQKITASNKAAENEFGFSVAVYNDLILVGTNVPVTEEGQAYLFKKATTWSQIENFTASDGVNNNAYGSAIAINDGSVFIGATGESFDDQGANEMFAAGAVYIYQDPADILGVDKYDSTLEFSIYIGNDNLLTIFNPTQTQIKNVDIYTISGQLIKSQRINNNISINKVNTNMLSSGLYFTLIRTSNGRVSVKKFIKK